MGTERKRQSFYRKNFTVVELVEYVLNAQEQEGHYSSFHDGEYFKENKLLSDELGIALGLYIDDFEICNPLGTSKKKHKVCGMYWVILNLPIRLRSTLSSIYLAALCKTVHIKQYGYSKVLEPLIRDIEHLEVTGVFVDFVWLAVKNPQQHDVRSGAFILRTPKLFDEAINVLNTTDASCVDGLKRVCLLSRLAHFHPAKGFPPDFLHDVLEGIVPVELSICLSDLNASKYLTLNDLNDRIASFPFQFLTKLTDLRHYKQTSQKKGTIGGNGHENWALLRFPPLLIGHHVPESDKTWSVVLELKDIVELLSSPSFTTETLCYLQTKIILFPGTKLHPRHHYLKHYPVLIKKCGPLFEFWTIRFEAKHL